MSTPTFSSFYQDVHGVSPFPWQKRLAERVLAEGWPALLDLPTAAGKTSALDIALYALATAPERMSRRIVLVVDRRIVVDQAADRAKKVLRALRAGATPATKSVADALRGLWAKEVAADPFAVAVLRGGMPRDNDWARRPDQPVVGLSTIDQLGSRLLFRGYGLSPKSAPIHAGLLGNDTLVLLDEVHLAAAFADTLRQIGERYRKADVALPTRFQVVEMSATPNATAQSRFGLGSDDREHPVLKRRLVASKITSLKEVGVRGSDEAKKKADLAKVVAEEATQLATGPARVVGVVVNRVETARLVYEGLAKAYGDDVVLLTGRMRPLDRDAVVEKQLLPRAGADRDRSRDAPFFVVATQCIEAGADLDFDALVTECASLDALRQRFGRLDRRGEFGMASAIICCRSDALGEEADDPVYGAALAATWRYLEGLVPKGGGVDFGIEAFPVPSAELLTELVAPPTRAPVLLAAHLDALVQTSPPPAHDVEIATLLHGPDREAADVQVVWRADVTEGMSKESVVARLAKCRPSALEAISLPIGAARRWLTGGGARGEVDDVADVSRRQEDDWPSSRGPRPEVTRRAFVWAGEDDSNWLEDPGSLTPGAVLVVSTSVGGIGSHRSFDPDTTAPVSDLGNVAQLRARATATVRLDPAVLIAEGLVDVVEDAPTPNIEATIAEERTALNEWLTTWPNVPPKTFVGDEDDYALVMKYIGRRGAKLAVVDGRFVVTAPIDPRELRRDDPSVDDEVTEDDDSSFRSAAVTLRRHSTDVKDWASQFAQNVGMPQDIVDDLALAGWLHDIGKADPRFQRWLVGGSEVKASLLQEPLAKSSLPPGSAEERRAARLQAGYPAGYRHELLSLAMVQGRDDVLSRAHDRELVLHLVASHHGWCRSFAPFVDHPDEIAVELHHGNDVMKGNTRHRLAGLDAGVAPRFWRLVRRYGWWGLAWLEALLRLSDHHASRIETEGA